MLVRLLLFAASIYTLNLLSSSYGVFGSPLYLNHTSDKYQVQFQYPAGWDLTEKSSRFDEGADIQVHSYTPPSGIMIISYVNLSDTESSLGFDQLVYQLYKDNIDSDYSKEIKVIEQPSFLTIDGQRAGTFLYTSKDKYEENAVKSAIQTWIVTPTPGQGYIIMFSTSPDNFDMPEVIEIRDHIIKSIKFLGVGNTTESNKPSRFD